MRLLLLVLLVQLSACSWLMGEKGYFRDRSDDYRKARVEPHIKVPANLDDAALQDIYVIPPITEEVAVTGGFEVPRPSPLVSRGNEELVRIQRLGDEEWMLVAVAPGQLRPQVRSYLTGGSIRVARVDARAGLIETGWMQGSDATMGERYQFRIEQGVQRNTSELHILQQYQAGDVDNWPQASADEERSSAMLLDLAQYIASNTDTAPVSMMAQQQISASGKVSLQEDAEGEFYIRLELPYYRAWASLGRALPESDFKVRDLDRSGGRYFVRLVPPKDEDSGWFDWLFSSDEEASEDIGDKDFILAVEGKEENLVVITISREDGEALEPAQTQALLNVIKGNIN